MRLSEALRALAPALAPTERIPVVPLVLKYKLARAYNGMMLVEAPLNDSVHTTVVVDAAKFKRIWTDDSRLSIGDTFVVITRGKMQFKLPKITVNTLSPEFIPIGEKLSTLQLECLKLAAKFASQNAIHKWACGVSVNLQGAIATNNQTLVLVPCVFPFEQLTFPTWAIDALPSPSEAILMGWDDRAISYEMENGVRIQAQRLSEDMPDIVAATAEQIRPALMPFQVAADMVELRRLKGRYCVLSDGILTIEGEHGEQATVEIDSVGKFRMSMETAELVFSVATHVDFDEAPSKLRFSKQSIPRLHGFAAGMR